mmetsp:Transcript_9880/g.18584  ORF Transcript_9880/g.18584 Transcript_9880/m.18584 type:complete len:223 (-) Transcript_9880:1114-1782(-)
MLRGTTGRSIKMHQSLNLSSNDIVQTPSIVQVNKTITNPFSRANVIIDLIQQIKCTIYSIFCRYLAHGNCRRCRFCIIIKNICTILGCNTNHVSSIRPIHFLCSNINFTNEFTTFPIVKQDRTITTFDSNEVSTKKSLCRRSRRPKSFELFKVFENFHTRNTFTNGIITSTSSRPDKIQRLSKSLVTKSLRCINDKLSVTTNSNKTPIAVMLQHLWVQFTSS